MNKWSRMRKMLILLIVFLVVAILIIVPTMLFFYEKPTCFDGKQNGDETGIDCGGSCALLCRADSLPLISRGDPRVLTIAPGAHEVVVLIENPNTTGEVYRASYIIKVYSATDSIPIRVIEGSTYVPKATTFTIFEGPFSIEGGAVPVRATFEWVEETLVWQVNREPVPEVRVVSQALSRESSNPRIDATVENMSLESVSNIDLVALVYDERGNIFASSKTFIDQLPSGARTPIVFAWPRPFTSQAVSIDIQIRIFPDRSFIR